MPRQNLIKTLVLVVCLLPGLLRGQAAFREAQLNYKRVQTAYSNHWTKLQKDLKTAGFDPADFDLYFRVFKQEQILQVWMKSKPAKAYRLFRTYEVCAPSGTPGPKRQEGDGQVPEGFYKIDLFNPTSNYHLSLRVSYPNASDQILKTGKRAGGAIMVHGNCVTIGCLPMTDTKIEELYVLCVEAQSHRRPIAIDIFPARMSEGNLRLLTKAYPQHQAFWKSLLPRYTWFEEHQSLAEFTVDKKGVYRFTIQ